MIDSKRFDDEHISDEEIIAIAERMQRERNAFRHLLDVVADGYQRTRDDGTALVEIPGSAMVELLAAVGRLDDMTAD